jgi:PAS domain S-box-containing protein
MVSNQGEDVLGEFQHQYWRSAPLLGEKLAPLSAHQIPEDQFKLIADNIPVLCWMANGDGYIVWYNRRWHEYSGTTPTEMEGWGWQSVHDPEVLPAVMERWTQSIGTGEPFEMTFPLRGADGVFRPFLTRVQPVRDATGDVVRWFGVNTEISAQQAAEQALRESEERLRLVQAAGRIGSFDYDVQNDRAVCSEEWYDVYGLPLGTPVSLERMSSVISAEDWPKVRQTLERAIAERKPLSVEYRINRQDSGELRWLSSSATMVLDSEGRPSRYIGGVIDITERTLAAQACRDSEERLRLVLDAAPGGFYAVDREGNTNLVSRGFLDMLGFQEEQDALGRKLHDLIHHTKPNGAQYPVEECPIYRCASTGQPAHVAEESFFRLDGTAVPVEYWATPIRREGEHIGASCTIVDLRERKQADAALREESRTLETLNSTGSAIAAELDLERLVQMVTDAGVELTGAQFGAFFYNVLDPGGEKYLLYALAGADRADFDRFGMPRATAIFHPTFMGEGVVRSDDITVDPRYGKNDPHRGMPEGHLPVRSYLAVSVISRSGEVIGGLFFGHPEVARFTARHERLITGIAAQAAVGIDNARLYEAAQREVADRMRAEAALRELNDTLEQRVTEEIERRAEAEEALRQSQKMETVGQLTGGIAHDFNNLLQIVSGNLDILCRKMPDDAAPLRRYAERAMAGAQRASTLTQRLLAFSRRQPLAPKPTDVNRLLPAMSELLHRTLGETIEVEAVLPPRIWLVETDPNQLENAILNLAVNARDAMPEGGKLTIETQNTHLDETYASQNPGVATGQYVVICISDTGVGMDADTAAKAIEPFFTTKEVGKGTGLGLSMVYGFIKQSGGHLKIYSEAGEGTTVKIYLPRLVGQAAVDTDNVQLPAPPGTGEETILVCEDDEEVRAYSAEVLRELGYRVLEAADGPAALALLRNKETKIDLLFTDVVLPGGMSGAVLAKEAVEIRPGLKTLFTTGYARNAIVHQGRLDPGVQLITKPFSYADLATRIRDILDKPVDQAKFVGNI